MSGNRVSVPRSPAPGTINNTYANRDTRHVPVAPHATSKPAQKVGLPNEPPKEPLRVQPTPPVPPLNDTPTAPPTDPLVPTGGLPKQGAFVRDEPLTTAPQAEPQSTAPATQVARSLEPPTTEPQASAQDSTQIKPTKSIQNLQDVVWTQERLRLAGFLKSPANGVWDAASKAALRDFKATNGLATDDVLDTATVVKLNQPIQLHASRSFIGGWSAEPACPSGVQIEVSSRRASVAAGACEFGAIAVEPSGWRVRATCRVAENSWTANIKLQVRGDRLIWSSEKGTATYFRCG